MSLTVAQRAIAKLIELAETGEINPWDVQVIEVIDRFLAEIPPTQADLPQSGQAFLWASMLVLLKANTLSSMNEVEAETEETEEWEEELSISKTRLPIALEKHLRRRSAAPPLRQRKVTLAELITQIKAIEVKLTEKPVNKRPRTSRSSKAQAISQLAHQENLTEIATYLEEFLQLNQSRLGNGNLELNELLHLLENHQPANQHIKSQDKVGVFWALLLLSAESKVELFQEEFYQDLQIKPLLLENT